MDEPHILVFTVAAWNSRVGSNTWPTLLTQYRSQNIANICIRNEPPDSDACDNYFVISENKVIQSVLHRNVKTGYQVTKMQPAEAGDLEKHNERYHQMKKKRRYSMLLAREMVWKLGRWCTPELNAFLDEFKPDIILHSMEGYIHLNRIIEYAIARTGAKAIGYIWDDNFTYLQSKALGYKVYRYFQRKSLKSLASKTTAFFAITEKTKNEADRFFHINCTVLTKPLNRMPEVLECEEHSPIQILYTGNLMIGRDATLAKVVNQAAFLNQKEVRVVIDVYTKTEITDVYSQLFDNSWCNLHSAIPQEEVLAKQREADVLLFLEDIDGEHAQVARLSFSTKITDYLSAGKCIFAVGNRDLAPISYLDEHHAALVADSEAGIAEALQKLMDAGVREQCARNAAKLGVNHHDAAIINKTFSDVISKVLCQ